MLEYKMYNFKCICRPNVKSKFQLERDEIVLTKSRLSITSRERRVVSRYRRSAPRRAVPYHVCTSGPDATRLQLLTALNSQPSGIVPLTQRTRWFIDPCGKWNGGAKRKEAMERVEGENRGEGRGGGDKREGEKEETGSHPCIKPHSESAARRWHHDNAGTLNDVPGDLSDPCCVPRKVRSATIDD